LDDGECGGAGEAPDEHRNGVEAVGEPATGRAGGHGEHDEAGGAQGGVVGAELVGGAQVRGQVDAERDEAAEADRV
jgi:hypothetical protein